MTAHNHSTRIPGCYRCELGEDEVRAQQTDPVHSEAVRRKVEDLCHEIGALRQELLQTEGDLAVAVHEARVARDAVERVRQIAKDARCMFVGCNAHARPIAPADILAALDGAE